MRCQRCGTVMYKYDEVHYCPNCDNPPVTESERDENVPSYVG